MSPKDSSSLVMINQIIMTKIEKLKDSGEASAIKESIEVSLRKHLRAYAGVLGSVRHAIPGSEINALIDDLIAAIRENVYKDLLNRITEQATADAQAAFKEQQRQEKEEMKRFKKEQEEYYGDYGKWPIPDAEDYYIQKDYYGNWKKIRGSNARFTVSSGTSDDRRYII